MNHVEDLWGVLTRLFYAGERQLNSVAPFKCQVETKRGKFGDQLRHSLVASISKCSIALLEAADKSTKYEDKVSKNHTHYCGHEAEIAPLNFPLGGTNSRMSFRNINESIRNFDCLFQFARTTYCAC